MREMIIGVDLHQRRASYAVMDRTGTVYAEEEIRNEDRDKIREFPLRWHPHGTRIRPIQRRGDSTRMNLESAQSTRQSLKNDGYSCRPRRLRWALFTASSGLASGGLLAPKDPGGIFPEIPLAVPTPDG